MKRWRGLLLGLLVCAMSSVLLLGGNEEPPPLPGKPVAQLRQELKSPDPRVRQAAAEELGRRLGQEDKP